jgi:hypothetical protein
MSYRHPQRRTLALPSDHIDELFEHYQADTNAR